MRDKNRFIIVCAALVGAVFLIGVVELFLLRFSGGDVYPPYSSLRSDPFGTKALYESLEQIPGSVVSRHMKPLAMLEAAEGVVFYNGMSPLSLTVAGIKELERYEAVLKRGARLILTVQPLRTAPSGKQEKTVIEERWGARLTWSPPPKKDEEDDDESDELPRKTVLYFDKLTPAWRIVQSMDGKATVIERKLGGGSVVLVSSAYLLSNEALVANRDSALLAALIGDPARRYTFDEFHFGVAETGSLAGLARKYGLQGFIAGLLLLTALFIWQSTSSFLPSRDVPEEEILGKSAASGFVNLLRRGVPSDQLLALCGKEWQKSESLVSFCPIEKRKQIEELAAGGGEPLAVYARITRILAERKLR